MGVLGLWQILESVGHPIKIEGLEGKRLGVDANVWLYKFIRGFREKDNATNIDSHKLGLYNRISKLLFYKIKPIFVFDGPAPVLKRRTLERRQNVRNKHLAKVQDAALKLFAEQLQGQYPGANLDNITIPLPDLRSHNLVAAEKFTDEDRDLFYLPPETRELDEEKDDSGDDNDDVLGLIKPKANVKLEETVYHIDTDDDDDIVVGDVKPDLKPSVDIHSEEFANLPAEVRYEILQDIKESRRRIRRAHALPEDAGSFSSLQLERLRNRRVIQEKIEQCERDICSAWTGECDGQSIRSFRMQSDSTSTMLYVQNKPTESGALYPFKQESEVEQSNQAKEKESTPNEDQQSTPTKERQSTPAKPINKISPKIFEGAKELLKPFGIQIIGSAGGSQSALQDDVDLSEGSLSDDSDASFLSIQPEANNDNVDKSTTDLRSNDSFASVKTPEEDSNLLISSTEIDSSNKADNQVRDDSTKTAPETVQSNNTVYISDSDEDDDDFIVPVEKSNDNDRVLPPLPSETRELEEKEEADSGNDIAEINSESNGKFETTVSIDHDKDDSVKTIPEKGKLNETVYITDSDDEEVNHSVEPISKPSNDKQPSPSPTQNKQPTSIEERQPQPAEEQELPKASQEKQSSQTQQRQHILVLEKQSTAPQASRTNRVTSKIVEEAKELLRLFGIPYIDAEGEAEAECASLERMKLTEGTITDDSDVWLFGAQNVYRYFFSDDKYVMQYKMTDIEFHIRMTRENLVCFAMMVGSDYTDGIMNIGPVTALEVLSEFPGPNMEPLIKFKNWKVKYESSKDKIPGSRNREKLLKFKLPDDFPSKAVFDGYMRPAVDSSSEKFSWGMPELDELRDYARRNFGWSINKIDEKLLPVMKKLSERKTQPTIDSFFFKTAANQNPELFRSKRINQALNKIAKTTSSSQEAEVVLTEDENDIDKSSAEDNRKRAKKSDGTKAATARGRKTSAPTRGRRTTGRGGRKGSAVTRTNASPEPDEPQLSPPPPPPPPPPATSDSNEATKKRRRVRGK